ncbi:putative FBD-associated F-box protein At5g56400 [Miscanthus floridulus]|uniref:putative FBD-associated F-box protein At5g56400 n=1 Tax=Miscanthus floridulus TaxID=154761 RepID=UPI003458E791
MGVRSRSKRRRGTSAGGADRISGLGDDVLVRILELLPDEGDAVRTGALSRRWRGLWTRVNSLTFDSSRRRLKSASSDKRFLDFVHNALVQCAKTDAALEHLAISFAIMSPADDQAAKPLVLRSTNAAQEWIWKRIGLLT